MKITVTLGPHHEEAQQLAYDILAEFYLQEKLKEAAVAKGKEATTDIRQ